MTHAVVGIFVVLSVFTRIVEDIRGCEEKVVIPLKVLVEELVPISIELESEAIKSFPVWTISLLPPENEIKISKILMEICLINNRITATNVLFNQLF